MKALLDFLNDNSGALTFIATAVLAILTARYVVLTGQLAKNSKDQVDALQKQVKAALDAVGVQKRQSQGTLRILTDQLLQHLDGLHVSPMAIRHYEVALWTETDLADLQALTPVAAPELAARAASAVPHLRYLSQNIEAVKHENPGNAFRLSQITEQRWKTAITTARSDLEAIRASLAG